MKVKNLNLVAKMIAGQSPPSTTYNTTGEGLPFFQGKADFQEKYPNVRNWCTSEKKKEALPGDILITVRAPVGPVNICNQRAVIGRGISAIRPLKGTHGVYLYYFLKSKEQQIAGLGTGSTFKAITQDVLGKIQVPLPKFDDQIRIATLLSRVEALIATRKNNLRLLDEFLKSTFLEMFGDSVRNEREWEIKDLGEIFHIKHGFAFKSDYFSSSGKYVLLTPGNFYEEGGYRDRGDKQKYYTGVIPIEYLLKKNDLLVAMTEQAPGLLGSPILVPKSNRFLHNQRLGLIELKIKKVSRKFLFYLFNTKGIRGKIHSRATGTKVRHTSPTKIEQITIGFPPINLQDKFSDIAEKAEYLKTIYQQSLNELENLYGALSQKAFKGELDLSRIPLEKIPEKTVSDTTTQPTDQFAEPDGYAMSDPAARKQLLHQLFDAFIAERKSASFSLDDFWPRAEQKVMGHMDDESPPLGVDDYEMAKEWLFDLLKSGQAAQRFNEEKNRMELSTKR